MSVRQGFMKSSFSLSCPRLTLHLFLSEYPSFFLLACVHSVLVSCCDWSRLLVYLICSWFIPSFCFTHLYHLYIFPLPAVLLLVFCHLLFYSSQFRILFFQILDISSLKCFILSPTYSCVSCVWGAFFVFISMPVKFKVSNSTVDDEMSLNCMWNKITLPP